MRGFFLFSAAVIALGFFPLAADAAVSSTEIASVVKLQVYNEKDALITTAAGVQLDFSGRILTTYNAIRGLDKAKKPIHVCPTVSAASPPVCNWRAAVIASNTTLDLALLQVRSVHQGEQWLTPEEAYLRTQFSFTPLPLFVSSTSERATLGETLWMISYPEAGGAALTTQRTSVTSFTSRQEKKKEAPWQIKTDTIFAKNQTGGAVFNESNVFVGIPAYTTTTANQFGSIVGIPAITAFLEQTLGASYVRNAYGFRVTQSTEGTHAGVLSVGAPCPEYADSVAGGASCKCREGFYAFGNACISGGTYCPLRYAKQLGTYDSYTKRCQCPKNNGGISTCTLPAVHTEPTKPTVILPIIPTSTKDILKNACKTVKNGEWNTKTSACACKTGFAFNELHTTCVVPAPTTPTCTKPLTLNTTGSVCIFVGIPTKQSLLASCPVIAKNSTKLYYLAGHTLIKQMTYKGKTCFETEAAAQKALFKKAK